MVTQLPIFLQAISPANNLKSTVMLLLDKLDNDSPDWEKIIGVLREDELTLLAEAAVKYKFGTVKGNLDTKLRDMVMRVKVPFEYKEQFLTKLSNGNGFFDGNNMLKANKGNIYSAMANDPIATIIAPQMALQFRGEMGYGPSQGPGEIMMVLLGENITLATKGDLQIGNKVAEIKATGRGTRGKLSGGRLYSTSGYGASTMIKRALYNDLVDAGIPKERLLHYGLPNKQACTTVIRGGLNLNPSGLANLSDLLHQHNIDQKTSRNILDNIINGLYTKLPVGMSAPMLDLIRDDSTFDPTQFLIELTKLSHSYYMMLEGHDVLMLFNSMSGNYALMSAPEEIEQLLRNGTISLSSHLDLDDDRSKGSSQLIIK
jgi:hypothetical protein